jgi:hypothetical protein
MSVGVVIKGVLEVIAEVFVGVLMLAPDLLA